MLETFVLSQKDGRPMYLQIIEQVKLRVMAGEWPAGIAMPSIREMAAGLNISVITIKRAYQELERDGVIVTQRGKGSFIASDPDLSSDLHKNSLHEKLMEVVQLARAINLSEAELQSELKQIFREYSSEQQEG
jgi:GntR family transcriptional regulator